MLRSGEVTASSAPAMPLSVATRLPLVVTTRTASPSVMNSLPAASANEVGPVTDGIGEIAES